MRIDLHELLTLTTIPSIGPTRLINLVSHFQDTHSIATASAKELVRVEGIEKKTALNIVNFFRDSGAEQAKRYVNDQLSRLNKADARILTYWDKEYPVHLKHIYDPPAYLFVRGSLIQEDGFSLAIVGTRAASQYGIHIAEEFAQGFARFGITTVSGLARGIDSSVHSATLKAGGRTLGVIGSGVDITYPAENKELGDRIAERGAILSEFAMGAKPDAQNFPRRNRIISGISLGTIIVESSPEGGSMITAQTALDQNREVFALPSAVNEKRQSGTNLLIKEDKARLVESVHDIISALALQLKPVLKGAEVTKKRTPPPQLSMFEQQLYDAMADAPIHIDALAERAGCSTSDALVQLLSLEFKGIVRQSPGKMFARIA